MRVIFMGTPDFSVPTLQAIIEAGHEVAAVYSQPPRPAGRGKKDRPSPVHQFAEARGIEVRTPASLKKAEAKAEFQALDADVAVVVAYGLILPQAVLDAPKHGCLNLHGSILPRWRGAAPIQRAIMAGDSRSGVQVMQMEAGLDTGPVCLSHEVEITPLTTAGELHDQLMLDGAKLMADALAHLEAGQLSCTPQPEDGATYARKIDKQETRIDWNRDAEQVRNHIHGLSPYPGAWFELELNGRRERVKALLCQCETAESGARRQQNSQPGQLLDDHLLVACASGAVRLLKLQRAGKRPMLAEDLLRGLRAQFKTPR